MRKEYRTIQEVAGPLMMVEHVEGVKYDELVEIEQKNGEIRHGRVLEVNGDRALLQLFEGSQGLKISDSKARFLGRSIELAARYARPRVRWHGPPEGRWPRADSRKAP